MTVKLPPTNLEKRKHRRIGRNGIGRKYRRGKMGTAGQPSCTRSLLPAQKVQS